MKATKKFDYSLDFKQVDFRAHPELYRVGRGEEGVLLVEPYKSELLPLWRFRTVEVAQQSATEIYHKFIEYLQNDDFVGADMARKYLQMGFTRARRYANHPSGRKYESTHKTDLGALSYPYSNGSAYKQNAVLPQAADALTNEKAKAAEVFKRYLEQARIHPVYQRLKTEFNEKYAL